MKNIISYDEFVKEINNDFDEFQKELEKKEKKLKFKTKINIDNNFYKLIDSISGSKLDESNR